MSQPFNSSISVVGIADVKVKNAILRLLENSLYLKRHYDRQINDLNVEIQRLQQMISDKQ